MAELMDVTFKFDELDTVARKLEAIFPWGSTIIFTGPLGAGKTTLISSLVKAYGALMPVSSPSYVLQNIYDLPDGRNIEHWDLYRVAGCPVDAVVPTSSGTIRFIEWGEKFEEVIDEAAYTVTLSYDDADSAIRRLIVAKLP